MQPYKSFRCYVNTSPEAIQINTSKSPLLAFIALVDSLLGSLAVFQSVKAAQKYGGGWTAATAATTMPQNRFEYLNKLPANYYMRRFLGARASRFSLGQPKAGFLTP